MSLKVEFHPPYERINDALKRITFSMKLTDNCVKKFLNEKVLHKHATLSVEKRVFYFLIISQSQEVIQYHSCDKVI